MGAENYHDHWNPGSHGICEGLQGYRKKRDVPFVVRSTLCELMWKMSSIRKRKATLWPLALLLLLATVAPKLSLMTCTSSGRTALSIGDAKDCCPANEQAGAQLNMSCCEFTSVQAEIPTFTTTAVVAPAPVQAVLSFWAPVIMAPRAAGHAFSTRPQCRPPRLLSDRLADLQVFRI